MREAMITPSFVRTMAAYNRAMNDSVYASAAQLSEEERMADRGAFWKSIHGTLAHLLWADRIQMFRLAGWPDPARAVTDSADMPVPFARMAEERRAVDALAAETRVPCWGLWLDVPAAILADRLAHRRNDASDADRAVLEKQLAADPGPLTWQRVSAAADPATNLATLRRVLSR